MGNRRMDSEDHETLFRSSYSPSPLYFVQSPSTVSHTANLYHVPAHTQPLHIHSSSRGSNASSLREKKMFYGNDDDDNDDDGQDNCLISHNYDYQIDDNNDDDDEYEDEEKGLVRFFSFRTYPSSTPWICLQILWRLIMSFGVALLVFYIATKPPPPHVSVEIAKIREFGLAEGADATGVTTKLLTINCSVILSIENKSNFFSLRIQSPALTMSFGHLPLAISYGPNNIYARSDGITIFKLVIATRNKPIYGGGIAMQDMLDIDKGLPLVVRLRTKSNSRVVLGLINPKFHHKAECLVLLGTAFDEKHHTHMYKSRCLVTS